MDKLSFLVIDPGGLHVDSARRIGMDGHKVWYYSPWHSAYPKFSDYAPGVGVPEIEKVLSYAPYIDQASCIVFPDSGMGELCDWLRNRGYAVFGAGLGENLEFDRIFANETYQKLGIKFPKTWETHGLDEALDTLKQLLDLPESRGQKNETNQILPGDLFVKFNIWRGSAESFPVNDLDQAQYMFDKLKPQLGPYAKQIPVIIQKKVEGIETGGDLFFNGSKFISPGMWGFEHGGDYLGYVGDDLSFFSSDLNKISNYLKSINYRGAFSFETIWDGKDHYWLDATPRHPMPLGLMYSTFIPNFGEFIYDIAQGHEPKTSLPIGSYLACMQITSEEALGSYLSLKGGPNTKFMRYVVGEDNTQYAVPGVSLLGIASAQGKTFEELQKNIQEEADQLAVYYGDVRKDFLNQIHDSYIKPLREQDIVFGDPDFQPPSTVGVEGDLDLAPQISDTPGESKGSKALSLSQMIENWSRGRL